MFYDKILDMIDTTLKVKRKPPKNICLIKFDNDNKAIGSIRLSKIINNPELVRRLPVFQDKDNIPKITYI